MTRYGVLLLVLFFNVYFTKLADAQDSTKQHQLINNAYITDLDLALKLSKETKQNVVIIFSADWCGYCKNLKQDLPTIEGFDNTIICIIDSDKDKKNTRQFKVKSLPTSVILNSDKQEVARTTGYDKKSYIEWLKRN